MFNISQNHSLPICHLCLEVFDNGQSLFEFKSGADRELVGFSLFHEIQAHLEMHLAQGERFACDKCTLSFANATGLICHHKAHHSNRSLPKPSGKGRCNLMADYKQEDFDVSEDFLVSHFLGHFVIYLTDVSHLFTVW